MLHHLNSPAGDPGVTATLEATRAELAQCLSELTRIPGVDENVCTGLSRQIAEMTFNLVVAGQFKRGKSTLINALLGDPLLPTGVLPLTSIVTAVRYGPNLAARIQREDGSEAPITLEELPRYVTERGNPRNEKRIRQVVIDHPSRWLLSGVHLVDTPGIGSVYQHNTDVTQRYLPQADAVLFIASVDQPLGTAELDFLANIKQHADKIFCLLNKTDSLEPSEIAESVAFATDQIRTTLGAPVPLFPVSAKLALQGKRQGTPELLARSGFAQLEDALGQFMTQERNTTWLASIAKRLLRVVSELRFTLQLEAKLLITPEQELDRNLTAFTDKRREVQRAASDHQVLLEADARALLLNDIEPTLTTFKERLKTLLSGSVEAWYGELETLRSSTLQEALEARLIAEIRTACEGWIAREDAKLRTAFETICARAWSSLQATVDELTRYSSELFSVDFAPIRTDAHWTQESNFYYKFWYEPPTLKMLGTAAMLALPKALVYRLIIKRTRARALELIESQAGRIRHDFQERMKASVRAAQRQIVENTDSIIERIETAVVKGVSARRQGAAYAEANGRRLADLIQTATAIEKRVNALVP